MPDGVSASAVFNVMTSPSVMGCDLEKEMASFVDMKNQSWRRCN
jgi:hypothetical protein